MIFFLGGGALQQAHWDEESGAWLILISPTKYFVHIDSPTALLTSYCLLVSNHLLRFTVSLTVTLAHPLFFCYSFSPRKKPPINELFLAVELPVQIPDPASVCMQLYSTHLPSRHIAGHFAGAGLGWSLRSGGSFRAVAAASLPCYLRMVVFT